MKRTTRLQRTVQVEVTVRDLIVQAGLDPNKTRVAARYPDGDRRNLDVDGPETLVLTQVTEEPVE